MRFTTRGIYKGLATFLVLIAVLMPMQRSLEREAWVISLVATLSYGISLANAETAGASSEIASDPMRGIRFVALLSLAGLTSGVLTVALPGVQGMGFGELDASINFGAIIAFCFARTGVTRSSWRLLCFFALAPCALIISIFSAEIIEMGEGGTTDIIHPLTLFVGGMLGGFLILGGAHVLSQSKMGFRAITWKALRWSILTGAMAPIAWVLGPSLGIALSVVFRALGFAYDSRTFSALYSGPPSQLFALFVVWQTAMGFALGMSLRKMRETEETSSLQELKLT
jgi:hypothetical protein